MNLHPLHWMQLFIADSNRFRETFNATTSELPVRGQAKLLMYGDFVKSRATAESRTIQEVIEEEFNYYDYSRKKTFHEPYFAPVDLSYKVTDFKPSLTDAGICQVYNGDSLSSIFTPSPRIYDFQNSLDPRTKQITPLIINGTGKISEITMWLDASNKNPAENMYLFEKEQGGLIVAINAWNQYYDVRINQLDLRAGSEVIIKVEPVVHYASDDFRRQNLNDRKCRFKDELKVVVYLGFQMNWRHPWPGISNFIAFLSQI